LIVAATAKAEPFDRTYSGWSVATEIDTNGDGQRADSSTGGSKGKLGQATLNIQDEVDAAPSGICFGAPSWLERQVVALTVVERYPNGDLLILTLDLDPANPSTSCYNFADATRISWTNLVVVGGSGRFEGATGWAIATTSSAGLAGEPGIRVTHRAFFGSLEGEIFLADD